MKKQTIAIDTPFQKSDAYGALSMPVYHTLAYEFADADVMSDAFCGRIEEPDYSRVMNPTVTYFENRRAGKERGGIAPHVRQHLLAADKDAATLRRDDASVRPYEPRRSAPSCGC